MGRKPGTLFQTKKMTGKCMANCLAKPSATVKQKEENILDDNGHIHFGYCMMMMIYGQGNFEI